MRTHCPICTSSELRFSDDLEFFRCMCCGVIRTKYDYDASQYGESYSHNYEEYAKTNVNTPLNLFRVGLVSRWLKEYDRILDVGCCIGEFIRHAEPYYDCYGFEPNTVAAREARKRVRSNIVTSLNGDSGFGVVISFKAVTMFDVLEHVQEPVELLKHISKMLAPSGIVAITTPNVEVRHNGNIQSWKHYKPKEHLFLYSENALETLLVSCGLHVIHWGREESDIRPGNPNGDILTCVAQKT